VTCKHEHFQATVNVGRITEEDDPTTVRNYLADIRVKCAACDLPFEFLGLPIGMDLQGAMMSPDGQEARLAITPRGLKPNPLHRMAFGITKFDG
jgi:hypothetical protein